MLSVHNSRSHSSLGARCSVSDRDSRKRSSLIDYSLPLARTSLGYDEANAEQPRKKRKIWLLAINERPITSPTTTESTLATTENALGRDEDDHVSPNSTQGNDTAGSDPLEKHAAGNILQSPPDSAGNSNTINHFPELCGVEEQGSTVQGLEEAAIHESSLSSNASACWTSNISEANPQAELLLLMTSPS